MMPYETPGDPFKAYEKFLKKKEYKKAYRCLEKVLHEFPDDIDLLEEVVDLCLKLWEKPDIGRKWLIKLSKVRSVWVDFLLLSHVEAELGNIGQARELTKRSRKLQKTQPWITSMHTPRKMFSELEGFIKYKEQHAIVNAAARDLAKTKVKEFTGGTADEKTSDQKNISSRQTVSSRQKSELKSGESVDKDSSPVKKIPAQIPTFRITPKIDSLHKEAFSPFIEPVMSTLKETLMFIDYMYLTIQGGFDDLLCLNAISGIEKYWYQIETAKKVLKHFHGRVLLCDEVGLGKTIEAGMLIKEYLMRGMIKNLLILTPSPLVSQWKEEMQSKFDIEFVTTDDIEFMRDSRNFWKERFIIASINTAKSSRNMPVVTDQFYDLVVVDEAHHLRNRKTLSWKLVNQIRKKFIFLLTATPIQNNLIELFNLITLLKPGQFKTERQFKETYVKKGNLKATADKERLRELLRDVMIRNTRSAIDLKLTNRFATTVRLEPTEVERVVYKGISEYLRRHAIKKPMINLLLREVGSSPFALRHTLSNMKDPALIKGEDGGVKNILDAINNLENISKGNALIEILLKNQDEKKIVFTHFLKSMDYIADLLRRHRIPFVEFRGGMSLREKDLSIARFRNEIPVLVSTESGGEGRNMQFCNTIINFDLPWNPMRIEQRIGRLHRIGQTRDVFIFNLSIRDTIEDYIIEILDSKINMFEMVIGEIEPILGYLGEDRDFEEIVMGIWLKSSDEGSLRNGFEHLGGELFEAKNEYLKTKALDNDIFGEDYET